MQTFFPSILFIIFIKISKKNGFRAKDWLYITHMVFINNICGLYMNEWKIQNHWQFQNGQCQYYDDCLFYKGNSYPYEWSLFRENILDHKTYQNLTCICFIFPSMPFLIFTKIKKKDEKSFYFQD